MAIPDSKTLDLYQGDTFDSYIRVRSRTASGGPGPYVDLTGCSAAAQIRASASSNVVLATFVTTVPDQLDTDLGRVNFSLSAATTTAFTWTNAVWDLQLTFPDGAVKTLVRGDVTVTPEITR